MSETHNNVGLTQSDALTDEISAGHIVLERSPPDYVKKISQYLERSAGPSSQNGKPEVPPEVDSDSGDSLFITQLPVPQPMRTVRRRKSSRHSFTTELEDSEGDISSSQSDAADHETSRKKRKKRKITLPKYNFSFLTERKWKSRCTNLTSKQNLKFHNNVMGGFFKCVELWQRAEDLYEGQPTVDQDDEDILPLTEDEGEDKSGDEDIKVVEKKRFLAKSKIKWQQAWHTPLPSTKQHEEEEGAVTQEREKTDQISSEVPTSSMALAKDKNDEPLRIKLVQTRTLRRKRTLFPEDAAEPVDAETTPTTATPITLECTDDTAQAPQAYDELVLHGNKMSNFSHVTNTQPTEDDNAEASVVASVKMKENKRQEVLVNLELDHSVQEDAKSSLSRDELTEKNKLREVEDDSCVVSEPLSDERQLKKKKKKKSHQEPRTLDTLAASQKTAKRQCNKFPEDDVGDKSEEKMSSCLSEGGDTFKRSDDNDVQPVSKKKKKKKSRTTIPPIDEFVCGLANKNDRTSSFLDADVEESSAALEAELHHALKKKRKKKSSGHRSTEDFVGASSHSALPVKVVSESKKKRPDSQVVTLVERNESTAGSAFLKPDEGQVKKKPKDQAQFGELNLPLNQAHHADDATSNEAPGMPEDEEAPDMAEDDTVNYLKDRKRRKKKKKEREKLLTSKAELEEDLMCDDGVQHKKRKNDRHSLTPNLTPVTSETDSLFQLSPSDSVKKKKHKKSGLTRHLYR
ncbi:phoenix [Hippocampus zosterae]|uniref:phoenix n=1 Tax=Hippocampus zosterae TaxID=109293 RepID=UPI00223D413C|nr:phoenix [Hippocampus zosterae]